MVIATSGRLKALLAFCPALLAMTWGAATARADDWTSQGLDGAHSRRSSEQSGAAFGNQIWSYDSGGTQAVFKNIVSSPAVADGFIVFGTAEGLVRALRATDGAPVWEFRARDGVQASPAIRNGLVYVPSFDGKLQALHLADGSPAWDKDLGGIAYSSPTVAGDAVLVTAGFPVRGVVGLDTGNGVATWLAGTAMEQFSNSSPVVAGSTVILGSMQGKYYGFDRASGTTMWTYDAAGLVNLVAPAVVNGRAYFAPGGTSLSVHAVDVATGVAAAGWPIQLAAPPPEIAGTLVRRTLAVSSPAVAGGLVVFQIRFDDYLDTDKIAGADTYLLREYLVAVDGEGARVVWQIANGHVIATSFNDIPKLSLVPSPAAYLGASGGEILLACASSLAPTLTVVRALTGEQLDSIPTAGATRASPVMANGRLFVATDNGLVQGFLSNINHPPQAPLRFNPAGGQLVNGAAVTLRWDGASDREGGGLSYEVRLDDDGELLEDWKVGVSAPVGQAELRVSTPLREGVTYTYAVRARDARGAYSSWSAPQTFGAATSPAVTAGGRSYGDVADALRGAPRGSVVEVGAGTLYPTQTLEIPEGVTLSGSGAGMTVIDGANAGGVAVRLRGDAGSVVSTALAHVTVTHATVAVQASGGGLVQVRNVVVRDNTEAGIAIPPEASAELVNLTGLRNGTAIRIRGSATVRNSIIADNGVGIDGVEAVAASSRYNDLYGNRDADYRGLTRGTDDLSAPVTFAGADDFRFKATQPTTDKGDPDDGAGSEPAPNGARINLGAFGGTHDAELSPPPSAVADGRSASATPVAPVAPVVPVAGDDTPAGCAVAGGGSRSPLAAGLTALLFVGVGVRGRRRRR